MIRGAGEDLMMMVFGLSVFFSSAFSERACMRAGLLLLL